METTDISLPGYKVFDYLLVLNPHEELRNRIISLRKEFNSSYHIVSGNIKPNLLLASFRNFEMMEERIINKLKPLALGYPPFKIELKDFGSFPSHTIYINVISKIPIQTLVKTIRSEVQRLMKFDDEHKPYFSLEPHITIAGKLKPWQYEKGWLEYSDKHFAGRFIADGMLLLKRQGKDDPWQIVHRFDFQNMPIITKQGELFG